MSTEQERFERAVSEAYERQIDGKPTTKDPRSRVVSLGRRRRAIRGFGSIALVVLAVVGATTMAGAFRDGRDRVAGPEDVPAIGTERIMEFGGPIAATMDELFVANGYLSNDAGDKGSIARYDLETGKVTNTDPTSMSSPQNVSLGSVGLWLVGWSGDLPLGGDESRARGRIQLVDPNSGEVLLDMPVNGSAPYDVAAGDRQGTVGWVVDAARNELVQVDATRGAITTSGLVSTPNEVIVHGDYVWVSSNGRGDEGGSLTRYEPESGAIETFPVDHCMNDLTVFDGSVWATDFCGKAVHRFDPSSGDEQAVVPLGAHPSAITVADGLVWVARDNDVVRIDPSTDELVGKPIVMGDGVYIDSELTAVGDDVFHSSAGGVYRLAEGLPIREPRPTRTPKQEKPEDPLSSETCNLDHVMCIPLDRESSIAGAGFGTAWVGNIGEGETFGIARFDSQSGEESARLQTDSFVQGFAPDGRWMWALMLASDQLELLKIDPATTTVEDSYDLGGSGNIGTASVAAGDGYVWVSQPNGAVARLSVADGDVTTHSYEEDLPGYRVSNGPLHLAFGEGRLWLSYGTGHLGMVDPDSGELVRLDEDALGVNAYEIVVAAGSVWSPHQSVQGDNVVTYAPTSETGKERGRVLLAENAPPGSIATDGERIWVTQYGVDPKQDGWLVEVDASIRDIVGEPLEIDTGFQGVIAAGDGFVWVTGNRVLYRVEPSD